MGDKTVSALNCPFATCVSVQKFEPGAVITIVDTVPGGIVQGREGKKWYKLAFGDVMFMYIHSSYVEPVVETPTPSAPQEVF